MVLLTSKSTSLRGLQSGFRSGKIRDQDMWPEFELLLEALPPHVQGLTISPDLELLRAALPNRRPPRLIALIGSCQLR